jgi:hypothetical protein
LSDPRQPNRFQPTVDIITTVAIALQLRARIRSQNGVTLVSWDQRFFDPIELPSGHKLVTLRDVARYIVKLPKAEQQASQWQAAAEVLMLIGEHGGDPMMARIGMMRALRRHQPKAAAAPRQKRAKAYRIIR